MLYIYIGKRGGVGGGGQREGKGGKGGGQQFTRGVENTNKTEGIFSL
jgi:hypothetical protein